MTPSRPPERVGPLYYRAVGYIDRLLQEGGPSPKEPILQKELAFGIGMTETTFSQKRRGVRSHFYEDEFEAIAEWLRRRTSRPLIGFPHIKWEVMEMIDRKLFGWSG